MTSRGRRVATRLEMIRVWINRSHRGIGERAHEHRQGFGSQDARSRRRQAEVKLGRGGRTRIKGRNPLRGASCPPQPNAQGLQVAAAMFIETANL
ncbi:hypothetical protein D3C73_1370710 [compost metagenome]